MKSENTELENFVQLTGFRDIDEPEMMAVKKVISSHVHRIHELVKKIDNLHITLKSVHQREKSEKYEIHAKLLHNGKVNLATITDRNLPATMDAVLDKLVNELD